MRITSAELFATAFADDGMVEENFINIKSVLDRDISIKKLQYFENEKGPGYYIMFNFVGEGQTRYTTTHSAPLMKMLSNTKITKILDGGDTVETKIIEKSSQKDKSLKYYSLE